MIYVNYISAKLEKSPTGYYAATKNEKIKLFHAMESSHDILTYWVLCLVVSHSLWPHELQPARLLCPCGFSRQEYWSGLPYPPPGDLPNPGIEPKSLTSLAVAGGFFTTSTMWEIPINRQTLRFIWALYNLVENMWQLIKTVVKKMSLGSMSDKDS